MDLLVWIILGLLAGWIASKFAGTEERQGCLTNLVVGVVGALVGGALVSFITGNNLNLGLNLVSILVSVAGAVLFLSLLKAISR